MQDLFFHFGAHKTASTSLQEFFKTNVRDNREVSATLGYVGAGVVRRGPFVQLLRPGREEMSASEIESTASEIRAAIKETGKNRLIISDENMLGSMPGIKPSLYPLIDNLIALIAELKKTHRVRGLLLIREQTSFIQSCFQFRVQQGHRMSLPAFLDWLDLESFSWNPIVQKFRDVLGSEITILPFELLKNKPDLFFQLLSQTHECLAGIRELPRANVSRTALSDYVFQQMRIIGRRLPHDDEALCGQLDEKLAETLGAPDWKGSPDYPAIAEFYIERIETLFHPEKQNWHTTVRQAIRNYGENLKGGQSPFVLSPLWARWIQNRFRADNERLFSEFLNPDWAQYWGLDLSKNLSPKVAP